MPEPIGSSASASLLPIEVVVEREHVIAFQASFERILAHRADRIRAAMDSVTGGIWTSHVPEPLTRRVFRPADVAFVLCDGPVACLYKSSRSLAQFAIVWLVDPAVRAALDAMMPGRVEDVPRLEADLEPPPRRSA